MICVLLLGSGAPWEAPALRLLSERSGLMVLKRCVDIADLLATATLGQAEVAVIGAEAPGLDVTAVDHLRRHGVRPVLVVPADAPDAVTARASRIGVREWVREDDLESLAERVAHAPRSTAGEGADGLGASGLSHDSSGAEAGQAAAGRDGLGEEEPVEEGRVIAVWGPAGAPGRTTVSIALAAELAYRDRDALLIDADPCGGSVAQQLGVLDEASGVLSAARLAASGELPDRLPAVLRMVGPRFALVSGLPRPDRWAEVRAGTIEHLVELSRQRGHVLVDTGPSLEEDAGIEFGTRPGRHSMTQAALASADQIVVVGSPDPVGLARLARGLVDLREIAIGTPVRVVINRMRSTLGWSAAEVETMVASFAPVVSVHFLPEDGAALDRAMVEGRAARELGDSAFTRAVSALVDDLDPAFGAGQAAGGLSRRIGRRNATIRIGRNARPKGARMRKGR